MLNHLAFLDTLVWPWLILCIHGWIHLLIFCLGIFFSHLPVSRLAYNDLPAVLSRFWLVLDTALAGSEESSWWSGHGACLFGE